MKKIFLIILILLSLTGCDSMEEKITSNIVENDEMLSYTIDGEKTDIKPTKEDGYIVNKIICDNGSDMMWDNDNWEVELTEINSKDRCKVDFTKEITKEGYRITVTSNMTSALDSLSKATTLSGTVKIYSKSKIESVTGCNGVIEDNKVIVSNITSNQTCNIEIEDKTLAGIIKRAYPPQPGRTDFSVIDNGTPNLYKGTDDQGTTYYFSGDGTSMNNWVKFADKWWRIIRINGNGSVRLLYAGDGNVGSSLNKYNGVGSTGKSAFNSTHNNPICVGWRYGTTGSLDNNRTNETPSPIYEVVNSWYSGLGSANQNYVDTNAIYCNDRNLKSGSSYSSSKTFYYAALERLVTNKTPIFTCSNDADKFTGGGSGNNNSLPVGLMTADEVAYAGGVYETNSTKAYYYLAKDGTSSITGIDYWWTMSPYRWSSTGSYASVFIVGGSSNPGQLNLNYVDASYIVRPVISLKPEVLVTSGDGSASTPYELSLN